MRGRAKHLLQAAVGFSIGGVLLYLAVKDIEPSVFWRVLTGVRLAFFLPILLLVMLLFTAFFWLKALRWSWLVRPLAPLRTGDVLPALMIGFMSNNVLPAHLGEFVRMYVLAKQHGLSKTAVLSTIVLERLLDFLAIVGVFAVTLQFVPMSDDLQIVRKFGYVLGAGCVVLFLCFLLYVWRTEWAIGMTRSACDLAIRVIRWVLTGLDALIRALAAHLEARGRSSILRPVTWILDKLHLLLARLPVWLERGRDKLLALLTLGVQGLYSLRNPKLLLVMFAVTLFHWSLNGMMLYLATISFAPDQPIPILAAFFMLGVCALGVTLPSAPGYVGTTQICFRVALTPFGVSKEVALAGSLYALFLGIIPVTLAGLFFAARMGLKLRTLREEAEKGQAPNGTPEKAPPGASD